MKKKTGSSFGKTMQLRIAATKTWRDQLVKDQKKIVSKVKRDQLQGYIDILSFWIDIGEYVQKFMTEK